MHYWYQSTNSRFVGSYSAFWCWYTPHKQRTWLNTLVGAVPGALPLLGGWSAATGTIHMAAWPLFLVLFAWQHPHFYALAVMYEEDYKRGGLKMLPVIESGYQKTSRQIIIYTIIMIASSLFVVSTELMGPVYLFGVLIINAVMGWYAIQMAKSCTIQSAKRLLLPQLLSAWVVFVDYIGLLSGPVWYDIIIINFNGYILGFNLQ